MRPHTKHLSAPAARGGPRLARLPGPVAADAPDRLSNEPDVAVPASSDAARASSGAASMDEVIDIEAVSQMLRIGRNKLYEMVARNQIPHRRFGRRIRFSRAAVMRWLDSWSLQGAKERQ